MNNNTSSTESTRDNIADFVAILAAIFSGGSQPIRAEKVDAESWVKVIAAMTAIITGNGMLRREITYFKKLSSGSIFTFAAKKPGHQKYWHEVGMSPLMMGSLHSLVGIKKMPQAVNLETRAICLYSAYDLQHIFLTPNGNILHLDYSGIEVSTPRMIVCDNSRLANLIQRFNTEETSVGYDILTALTHLLRTHSFGVVGTSNTVSRAVGATTLADLLFAAFGPPTVTV